jgi:RNA-directed DNA polymerase
MKGAVRLPVKVAELRRKLYQKAKQEPKFRFYALYDRICRSDVLVAAWWIVLAKNKSPGIDGVTCRDIMDGPGGVAQYLADLETSLRTKTYRPDRVKRVYIPKPDGRKRPLLVLEAIFEADFLDTSFGFRPGRKAEDALAAIRGHLSQGYRSVYDADLKGYFDTIPHDNLLRALQMRITDRSVLHLIGMWLDCETVETDDSGGTHISRSRTGTPQGGVISPLLSNVYLHWFEYAFHRPDGPAHWAGAKIVRYADDFVILARWQGARLRNWIEQLLEGRFRLTINREKTRVVDLNAAGSSLDFLGYTFRYDRDLKGRDHRYLNVFPSHKAQGKAREAIRVLTSPKQCFKPVVQLIAEINQWQTGWTNYFGYGYPRVAFRRLHHYVVEKLVNHLRRRSQRAYRPPAGTTFYAHVHALGLRRP